MSDLRRLEHLVRVSSSTHRAPAAASTVASVLAPALLATNGLAAIAGAQGADDKTSFDGAASMADQLAALDKLGLALEGITPAAGVDARVWTAAIVPGQEPTAARVALGRKLYFDTRPPTGGTVSCGT